MNNGHQGGEYPSDPTESGQHNPLKHLVAGVISSLQFVGRQLSSADLNLHEGRLRGSVIDAKYIDIPDTPPDN